MSLQKVVLEERLTTYMLAMDLLLALLPVPSMTAQ